MVEQSAYLSKSALLVRHTKLPFGGKAAVLASLSESGLCEVIPKRERYAEPRIGKCDCQTRASVRETCSLLDGCILNGLVPSKGRPKIQSLRTAFRLYLCHFRSSNAKKPQLPYSTSPVCGFCTAVTVRTVPLQNGTAAFFRNERYRAHHSRKEGFFWWWSDDFRVYSNQDSTGTG
jgi:hypothetical protein